MWGGIGKSMLQQDEKREAQQNPEVFINWQKYIPCDISVTF